MKIHVLGVPHTQTSKAFTTCAFTQKALKLCAMMHRRGHTVIHYGTEGSDVECSEHVSVVSYDEWHAAYPHPGTGYYAHDKPVEPYLSKWIASTRQALLARSGAPNTEIVALTWGGPQRDASNDVPQFKVESGIGYKHSFADYRVYESYAWLHMHLGAARLWDGDKWYWNVIPNAFDVTEFGGKPTDGEARKDFLYMGRLNADKGIGIAIGVCKEIGAKLTIVGQGDPKPWLDGNNHVTYLPPVGVEDRRKLLANARAVFCPSRYVEPFCGTAVEAQLSETPVITSDWGAFPEVVLHGKTGYRCRTIEEFEWAAKNIDRINPADCRNWAADNFSLERVALMYEEYFQQVLNVRTQGFYLANPNRTGLEALRKRYSRDDPQFSFEPHVLPPEPETKDEWTEAQDWEREWWGLEWSSRWDEEIKKQETMYFPLMGSPEREAADKTILDVGCGPVSMLQRAEHRWSRGVDPLAVSDETRKRYVDNGIEFLNVKAEDMPVDRTFDEVWMYNCLQHTDSPDAILEKVARLGHGVRIFEWLLEGKCPGHPQVLTEALFTRHFGAWDLRIWNVGTLRDQGRSYGYIAIHAVKPEGA